MSVMTSEVNEQYAEKAFSRQSGIFDEIYAENTIVHYKRSRVRDHVLKYLSSGDNMLELNSGTGDDAIFFAKKGCKVHATDISEGMQQQLIKKVQQNNLTELVSNELCSYTQLQQLKNKGPYDYIFSNFAGLNCTAELDKVLGSFSPLLKKDGVVTLVILPKFCLWETLLLFKGKFKTAFRRFFSRNGRTARVENTYFKCWYYNPSFIVNKLKDSFDLLDLEGLCSLVPPSYLEGFAEKHPSAYKFLQKAEDKLSRKWPWKYMGDYYIISVLKKP